MSDWDVDRLSLDAWVTDLETVVDAVSMSASRSWNIPGASGRCLCGQRDGYTTPYSVRRVRARRKEALAG